MTFWHNKKLLVTGGAGFLGAFLVRKLLERGVPEENIRIPRSKDMDLRIWNNCKEAVSDVDIIVHMAARVGGIGFNQKYPGSLFYDNALMGIQLIEAARQKGVEKIVLLGTICGYPKYTPVPFREQDIWNGYPEETNAAYGLAKKMLLVQAQAYRQQYRLNAIYLLPTNLYGPGDNFDPHSSHVIPALIKKCVDVIDNKGEKIKVWGTGEASREFLYVEDAADGILLATEKYNKSDPLNLGTGFEISIRNLVNMIVELTGFKGVVEWDNSMPDGQPRRSLDTSKAREELGFKARTSLRDGIQKTIEFFRAQRKCTGKPSSMKL